MQGLNCFSLDAGVALDPGLIGCCCAATSTKTVPSTTWRYEDLYQKTFERPSASQPLAIFGTSQTKKGKNEFFQNCQMSRWEQDSHQTRPGLSFTTCNQALASPSGSHDFCLTLGNFSVTLNLFRVKPAFVSQLVVVDTAPSLPGSPSLQLASRCHFNPWQMSSFFFPGEQKSTTNQPSSGNSTSGNLSYEVFWWPTNPTL